MKKTLLACAVLTTFAGAASAQSSVTLFGVVDAGLRHVKTGDLSTNKLGTDGNSPSRFGFRGVEALGNGLSANFWLEGGFNPDTGTVGSKLFSRRATVGLSSAFGELRLGRDTLAVYNNASQFDPFAATGIGSINNMLEGGGRLFTGGAVFSTNGVATAVTGPLGTTVTPSGGVAGVTDIRRADNQVSYFLPGDLGGVYGQASYSFAEGGTGRTNGLRLGWKGYGFDGAAAINNLDVDQGDLRIVNAALSYDFNVVKLVGQYAQIKLEPSAATGDLKERVWQLGAIVPVSAAGAFKVSYTKAREYAQARQVAVGYQHDLSKRTALYATWAQIKNKESGAVATGNFYLSDAPVPTLAQQKSTGYEFGIRHAF